MTEEMTPDLLRELPVVYEAGKPTSVVVSIELFERLLRRLEELEDRELFSDPDVIAGLQAGQADLEAGRVISLESIMKELGLDDELSASSDRPGQITY